MNHRTRTLLALLLTGILMHAGAAPVPKAILLNNTNSPATISVVLLSADSWRPNSNKEQLVVTNPKLLCLTAGAASARKEGESVSLVLHEVTAYGPFFRNSDPNANRQLQTTTFKKYTYSLGKTDWVQMDDELMTSEAFWQKFKAPARAARPN